MFGSNFRDFVSQDPAEIKDERLTKSCPEFGKLDSGDSGDSGNCSETEEVENRLVIDGSLQHFTKEQIAVKSKVGDLEFPLTQNLLSQVRVSKDNKAAYSGKQACRDLPTMAFIINNIGIHKETVKQWLEDISENLNYLMRAEYAFTKMFESVPGAEVPCSLILQELIRSCNQAGFEFLIYNQIHNIFTQYELIPTISEKTISIRCNSVDSLNIEYNEVMVVKNSDPNQPKQYKSDNKLEFTLKLQDGKIEYENGKVTFTIPEELKKYYANGKHLLDEISKCFADADNRVVEDLTAYFEQGPKSLVADPVDNSLKDEESSFVMASEDLSDLEKLVQEAVQSKDISALNAYLNRFESNVASVEPEVADNLVQTLNQFLQQENAGRGGSYPTVPVVAQVYAIMQYVTRMIHSNISDEEYEIVEDLITRLNNLRKLLEDRKDITTSPVEEQLTFPVATNSAEPEGDSGKQAGGNVLETKKENATINSIKVLTQKSVRNNFISCKEGVMGRNKKSGLNSKYSRTKQPISGKGAPIEDKKRTKKSEIHNKQLLVEPNADVSNKQPIDQEVHKFVDGVVKTSNKTPVGQPEDSSSGTGAGNDNGTNTCVDPNVTIPKILDFVPSVKDKQTIHDREDSGCGSGSSTPEISKEVPVFNDTHIPEAIDEYNKEGFTPLHVAAQKGDVNEGDRLIKLGANIEITSKFNQTNNYGDTALHLAAQEGHKDFVELLLNSGANVNSVSSTGSGVTPLHEAAYYGHLDVVKLLIERGANIDARDRHNFTPLMYASANGKLKVVELLLQEGANPCLQNRDSETALHIAAGNGYLDVARTSIEAVKDKTRYVNTQGIIGTALHVIAAKQEINEEHKKVIKLLLDNGADPYLKNNPKDRRSKEKDSFTIAREWKNTKFIEFMTSLDYSIPPQVIPTKASAPISGNNAPGKAEPDKNSQRTQNSKWPIILLSAGIGTETLALGMCFAWHASLLATGIVAAIGACLLVAAVTTAIVHYRNKPSNSLEDATPNAHPVNSPAAS